MGIGPDKHVAEMIRPSGERWSTDDEAYINYGPETKTKTKPFWPSGQVDCSAKLRTH